MKAKPHPEQGFRACLGILRLARSYGSARIEAACRRGNDIGAITYGSIKSILQHGSIVPTPTRSRRTHYQSNTATSAAPATTTEERRDDLDGRRSTMATSQLPIEHWHDIIGNPNSRRRHSRSTGAQRSPARAQGREPP